MYKGRPNETNIIITPPFVEKYDCACFYRWHRMLWMHTFVCDSVLKRTLKCIIRIMNASKWCQWFSWIFREIYWMKTWVPEKFIAECKMCMARSVCHLCGIFSVLVPEILKRRQAIFYNLMSQQLLYKKSG